MRNASTSTTSSGEDDGFASRKGSPSSTWRATTTMLTSMWKATPSVQSTSSSLPSSATREGSGSYRVFGTPSAAPSRVTPSIGEDDDHIRMHVRFPAWLRKIAAEQEKKPRSKYREARRVRAEEVYFPSAEMIRLCEARAREEAFRQHTSLVKMGRRPDISFLSDSSHVGRTKAAPQRLPLKEDSSSLIPELRFIALEQSYSPMQREKR